MRELRPRSYLVTPKLDAARRSLLAEYNVIWLPLDASAFESDLLSKLRYVQELGLRTLNGLLTQRRGVPGRNLSNA